MSSVKSSPGSWRCYQCLPYPLPAATDLSGFSRCLHVPWPCSPLHVHASGLDSITGAHFVFAFWLGQVQTHITSPLPVLRGGSGARRFVFGRALSGVAQV